MSQAGYFCMGAAALGAERLGDAGDGYLFVVRLRNLDAAAEKRAGALGKLTARYLPKTTIENVRQQLADGFKEKGMDATVEVVSTAPVGAALPATDFKTGVAVGAAAVALLWGAAKLIARIF